MAEDGKTTRRNGKWRRRLGWAAIAVVIALLVLYVGVPMAVRHGGSAYLSSTINGEVRLGMVEFDPWSLSFDIADTRVTDLEGGDVAHVERILLDAELRTLWAGPMAVVRELRVIRPTLNVEREADGTINLLQLPLPPEDGAPEEPFDLPLIEVARLTIEDGSLLIEDRALARPVQVAIEPLDVSVDDLQTIAGHETIHDLTLQLLGGTVRWDGYAGLRDNRIRGTLTAEGLDLTPLDPYAQEYGGYTVTPGEIVSITAELDLAVSDGKLQGTATVPSLEWRDVAVDAPHEMVDRAAVGRVAVSNLQADVTELTATLGELVLERVAADPFGDVQTVRLAGVALDGGRYAATVDTLELGGVAAESYDVAIEQLTAKGIAADARSMSATVASAIISGASHAEYGSLQQMDVAGLQADAAAMTAAIDSVRLSGATSELYGSLDEATVQRLVVDGQNLTLGLGALTATGAKALDLGTVQQVTLSDLAADAGQQSATLGSLEVRGVQANLDALMPSADADAPGVVTAVDTDDVAMGPLPAWTLQVGSLGVFDVAADFLGHPLSRWQALTVEDAVVDTGSMSAQIQRVALDRPFVRIGITESGEAEVAPLTRSEQVKAIVELMRDVEMTTVYVAEITGGEAQLDDRSAPGKPLQLSATDVQLVARDLLRSADTPSTYTFSARVGDAGRVESEGRFNPRADPATIAFTLSGQDLPLTVLDGYAKRYLGYGIDRGDADLSLAYEMTYPDLAGNNEITLDQFYLGEAAASELAIEAPIKLGIALLRDRSGQIKLRLPIEGDLDNPSFDFGQVIRRAVLNILVKAVTSPFSLLAGLVPAGEAEADAVADVDVPEGARRADVDVQLTPGAAPVDADALSQVMFEAGAAEVLPREARELKMLARALYERPEISLAIMGEASVSVDGTAVFRQEARQRIREQLAAERSQSVESVDEAAVERAYERAVRELYRRLDAGEAVARGQDLLPQLVEAARTPDPESVAAAAAAATAEQDGETVAIAEEIDVPLEIAASAVFARAAPPTEALAQLARQRAEATRAYLVEAEPELEPRLRLLAPSINGQPRANLSTTLE